MITLGTTGAADYETDFASLILEFSTTPMDKPPPTGSASLRTLGDTGAAASSEDRASLVLEFSTTSMDKSTPEGSASLRKLGDWVPGV